MIEPVLGGFVGEPLIETRTVAHLMASLSAGKSKTLCSELAPDEEHAIIEANLDRHYMSLLDEPVPMLGNMTPRRAVRSAKGREKLVTWLKLLENNVAAHDEDSAMSGYDARWMWQELGIADLRR